MQKVNQIIKIIRKLITWRYLKYILPVTEVIILLGILLLNYNLPSQKKTPQQVNLVTKSQPKPVATKPKTTTPAAMPTTPTTPTTTTPKVSTHVSTSTLTTSTTTPAPTPVVTPAPGSSVSGTVNI